MIRTADLKDVESIYNLISGFAKDNLMLPRPISELCENIVQYAVAVENNEIAGCCALQTYMDGLSEIKALAVKKDYQTKGIGKALVEYNLNYALKLKADKVFVLTYKPDFFEKFGFKKIDKESLPQKIWRECIKCPKFPNCDEIALIKQLNK